MEEYFTTAFVYRLCKVRHFHIAHYCSTHFKDLSLILFFRVYGFSDSCSSGDDSNRYEVRLNHSFIHSANQLASHSALATAINLSNSAEPDMHEAIICVTTNRPVCYLAYRAYRVDQLDVPGQRRLGRA